VQEDTVPLSEEEQRLLEQMEQALVAEDPKFASALRGSALVARSRRHAILAVLGFLAGVAGLMVGAIAALTAVAVVGFVLMLASAYLFVTAWRRVQQGGDETAGRGGEAAPSEPQTRRSRPSGSFIERMEERWRRRREGGDF
jgi:threonine/homoserine/homoserine lactone efflux protein